MTKGVILQFLHIPNKIIVYYLIKNTKMYFSFNKCVVKVLYVYHFYVTFMNQLNTRTDNNLEHVMCIKTTFKVEKD